MKIAQRQKKISKIACHVINTYQKVHFALMNINIVDVIFFGCRNLVHSNLDYKVKLLTFLVMTIGIYDVMDVWFKCSIARIRPVYLDDIPEQSKVSSLT